MSAKGLYVFGISKNNFPGGPFFGEIAFDHECLTTNESFFLKPSVESGVYSNDGHMYVHIYHRQIDVE